VLQLTQLEEEHHLASIVGDVVLDIIVTEKCVNLVLVSKF